jgi:hypothetical protein
METGVCYIKEGFRIREAVEFWNAKGKDAVVSENK